MSTVEEDECHHNNGVQRGEVASGGETATTTAKTQTDPSSESCKPSKIRDRHHSFGATVSLPTMGNVEVKRVRFADALGLDLVTVKRFDHNEDTNWSQSSNTTKETSATMSMQAITTTTAVLASGVIVCPAVVGPKRARTLFAQFEQPGTFPNFLDMVRGNKVKLESAFVEENSVTVKGVVRVLNMDYHKAVYVRWTTDGWKTMMDYKASYVYGSNDMETDKFQFKLYAPIDEGSILSFALRYHCIGQQFWDNNNGCNYTFLCRSWKDTADMRKNLKWLYNS